jgi:regulator of replication initiation timing
MGDSEMKRNAVYKILSNIDKIQAAKKIYNLQAINKELVASNEKLNDENSDLRTQLAKLKMAQAITPDESIADRVKRKRCTSRGN